MQWVSLGGTDPVQMEVEVATVVNDAFKGSPIDGILGLGFQALNAGEQDLKHDAADIPKR